MKNDANPPSTPATTMSIAKIPMFIAMAIGESLLPKQTGHASAAPGIPAMNSHDSTNTRRVTLQLPRLALKRRAVHPEADTACERCDAGDHIPHVVRRLILPRRPRREERGQDDRHRDEQQMKSAERHVINALARVRPRRSPAAAS